MIKIANYTDKAALRHKGWKVFSIVVGLQMMFIAMSYFLSRL